MNDLFRAVPVCGCESCREVPLPTYTRAYRERCEVDFIIAMGSHAARKTYLDKVENKRGINAAARLRDLAWKQMRVAA